MSIISAATAECKRSLTSTEQDRRELEKRVAEYRAKGGRVESVELGPVKYVPVKFQIKPERAQ